MPWKESVMQQRFDVISELLAGAHVTALARKYGVSRKTIYKWRDRHAAEGLAGLANRSRRPQRCPNQTAQATAEQVVALRKQYPHWGSRKLHVLLRNQREDGIPCERTMHRILVREGLIEPRTEPPPEPQRFEREQPNELWQLDFKSPLYLYTKPLQTRLAPLTVLDDRSRFLLGLTALPNQQLASLWPALWDVFGCYGLPEAILTDNANGLFRSHRGGVTSFTMRLWRLNIRHLHGRPHHPQTQGKVERLHRTLDVETLKGRRYETLQAARQALEHFRQQYNHERPHEALGFKLPRDCYESSLRPRPDELPQMQYAPGAKLRHVGRSGTISLRNCRVRVGEGLAGQQVQLLDQDPELVICYGQFEVRRLLWQDLSGGKWL